ncbi:MAG TPA: pyridoxamine 5'-phosphate oxidase [Gemmatimonadales bacterium]
MSDIPAGPIERFRELLAAAEALDRARLPEPTAFALATADADGRPSVRIVLLKEVDDRGFVFYTNYEGRKGRELLANPRAALCFHWQHLEQQVRVEGEARPVSDAEADAYFASRPRGSQLGAWASRQSRTMEEPGALERRLAEEDARFADLPVSRPPYWSGFRVIPDRIEFWRNQPSRLHVRHLYEREGAGWTVRTLYP